MAQDGFKELTQIEREEPLFREALRLHEIESCPLTQEDIAMFDMFHREGWSNEKCLQHIRNLVAKNCLPHAAE